MLEGLGYIHSGCRPALSLFCYARQYPTLGSLYSFGRPGSPPSSFLRQPPKPILLSMSIDSALHTAPGRPSSAKTAAPAGVDAPPKGQFMPIEYPLTSFASTPHNVACIAFILGAICSLGLASATGVFTGKHLLWSPTANAAALPPQGLVNALFSPFLGFYLSSWAFFHLMEFVVTSMYNPGKLSVSCESGRLAERDRGGG